MRDCYAPYNRNHDKLMFMDVRSAELTKYAANAMLATKISFMSEIANLAERLGADVEQVRLGIGSDPRIGYHFIYPGCGYGGSCFPKDVRALARTAALVGLDATLLKAVETVNAARRTCCSKSCEQIFDGRPEGQDHRALGPGLQAQHRRHARRAEPGADRSDCGTPAPGSRPSIPRRWTWPAASMATAPTSCWRHGPEDALRGADALAICTEWKQFRIVDFDFLKADLREPGDRRWAQPLRSGRGQQPWPALLRDRPWRFALALCGAERDRRPDVGDGPVL